ncbi:hypothetical protein D9M73_65050 [compost metagenome]
MKNVLYFLQDASYGRGVEVRIAKQNSDKEIIAEAKPIVFEPVEVTDTWREPAFTMERHDVQQLVDELWRLGYRPSNGEMSVGQLGATERHLNDLRAIAFAKLNIPKP